ncbi:unnamed protein product [Brassica rapa subsp. narinosa]
MHAFLSPDLTTVEQIANIKRPTDQTLVSSVVCFDLIKQRCQSWWMNHRGVSYTFGPEKVTEFLIKNACYYTLCS